MGKCSHCGKEGHTYRTCPDLTVDQRNDMFKKKKADKELIKKKKEEAKQKKVEYLKKLEEEKKKKEEQEKQRAEFIFHNQNEYEVALYWGFAEDDQLNLFRNIPSFETMKFTCIKTIHRIVAIPVLEVYNPQTNNADKIINHKQGDEGLFVLFDFYMCGYPDKDIEVKKEYKPKKTELEQWKEFGLKSHFLLQQIYKMTDGGKSERYENIEPFLDLVQDVKLPKNCTEADKEEAGIPSALTNIT
jgi:hypothetical protein